MALVSIENISFLNNKTWLLLSGSYKSGLDGTFSNGLTKKNAGIQNLCFRKAFSVISFDCY